MIPVTPFTVALAVATVGFSVLAAVFTIATSRLEKKEKELEEMSLNRLRQVASSSNAVAVITGANSGIGFALACQLASTGMRVILACRSKSRGEAAVARVLEANSHVSPTPRVELLIVDVSSVKSVDSACEELKKRIDRLDFLFCNAGIFPISGYNWLGAIWATFTFNLNHFFITGRPTPTRAHFLSQPPPNQTPEGVEDVFATHILGHYAMIRGLEALLISSKGKVIWTGSRATTRPALNLPWSDAFGAPDLPGDAYASAKACQDLLSAALDHRLKTKGVRSIVVCPGFVDTDIAPAFFRFFRPLLFRMRPLLHSFQVTPKRGASVLLHVAAGNPDIFGTGVKYVMSHGKVAAAQRGILLPHVNMGEAQTFESELQGLLRKVRQGSKSH